MRWKIASAFTLLLASALPGRAAPLIPALIPDSAKWVIHVNVDAARGTPLWEFARIRFVLPRQEDMRARARNIENITGARFPRDLHDVTLFGTNYEEGSVCILLHAAFDQQRTLTSLRRNPDFATINYNGHMVFGWRERPTGRGMYGVFMPGDIAAISPNQAAIKLALDTLDRKSPSLKPNSPLAGMADGARGRGVGPGRNPQVLWIAGVDLPELARAQHVDSAPYLQQMDNARLGISLVGDQLNAKLVVTAKSDKAAQQLSAIAEGRKAMITFSAADDRAAPRVKQVASVLQNLIMTTDTKTIFAELAIGTDKLDEFFEAVRGAAAMEARGGRGARGPATEARPAINERRP